MVKLVLNAKVYAAIILFLAASYLGCRIGSRSLPYQLVCHDMYDCRCEVVTVSVLASHSRAPVLRLSFSRCNKYRQLFDLSPRRV